MVIARTEEIPIVSKSKTPLNTLKIFIVFSVIMLIFVGLTKRVIVDGTSMYPTLETGDWLLVSRWHYHFQEPQRGDIVVFALPTNEATNTIKRIIGLPNDTVEIRTGQVYINGQLLLESYLVEPCNEAICVNSIWQLDGDSYFVMGDNRIVSRDSRSFGSIPKSKINGKVILRYWSHNTIQ